MGVKVDPRASAAATAIAREPDPPQPIFVLSLPRSGSTLVQRVIASHDGVATASEPWLMLPLLAAIRPDLPISGRWERSVAAAVHDFAAGTAIGRDGYLEAVRDSSLRVYRRAAGPGASYFVDKSPPYHWVARDLFDAFPDGRFIFLWRDPLSILSSIVETLCGGRWQVHRFRGALFHGIDNLVTAHRRFAGRAVALRYEDLVLEGDAEWRRLTDYIGIEFRPSSLAAFRDLGPNGLGDHVGARSYDRVSAEPLGKWRRTICNPLRREWADRYLRWIGRERLSEMGYDLDHLRGRLADHDVGAARISADALDLGAAALREALTARRSGGPASASRLLLGRGR